MDGFDKYTFSIMLSFLPETERVNVCYAISAKYPELEEWYCLIDLEPEIEAYEDVFPEEYERYVYAPGEYEAEMLSDHNHDV